MFRRRPAVGDQAATGSLDFYVRIPYPIKIPIPPLGYGYFLAEEKGFEPLQRFRALRDFESRLFDQLEYSSVTESL